MPALLLALLVFQGEGKDGVALLDGSLLLLLVRRQGLVDGVECGRGGESVCRPLISTNASHRHNRYSTVLEGHDGGRMRALLEL